MKTIRIKKNIIINVVAVLVVSTLYIAILFRLGKLGVNIPEWLIFITGFIIGILTNKVVSIKYCPYEVEWRR